MSPSSSHKKESTADEKSLLLKELRSLIRQIDEEGLRFLIKQATTLIYNQKVEELNRSRVEAEPSGQRARKKSRAGEEEPHVFFDQGKAGGTYFLDVEGKRAILDHDELMSMVKIAQSGAGEKTVRERLFRWLESHRDDILLDCALQQGSHSMEALRRRLQNDFSIREE